MGTRSNIYIEVDPGTYLGTYCHYDGYPSHMFPTLSYMSKDILLAHILVGMTQGGIRGLHNDKGATEYLEDTSVACVLTDPFSDPNWSEEFVWVKRYDDKVMWRHAFQDQWNFRQENPAEEQ